MSTPRANFTVTPLSNGAVVAAGGASENTASTEIFIRSHSVPRPINVTPNKSRVIGIIKWSKTPVFGG